MYFAIIYKIEEFSLPHHILHLCIDVSLHTIISQFVINIPIFSKILQRIKDIHISMTDSISTEFSQILIHLQHLEIL